MKKTLSLVLALVMVALMLPVAAFTTSADEAPYYYYEDFTKATPDNGSTGNISASLPTGWIAKDDPDLAPAFKAWPTTINYDWSENHHAIEDGTYVDEVKYIGVRFGGALQGIAMTDAAGVDAGIVAGTKDHTITIKWNTTHKFAKICFGWSGDAVPTKDTVTGTSAWIGYNYTGGPSNAGGAQEGFGDGENKGGNFGFGGYNNCADRRNEYGAQVNHQYIEDVHKDGVIAGAPVTTTIEIVDGAIVAVYNEIGGTTVSYHHSTPYAVKGYLSIWIDSWGANNTANVQSVEIKEGKMNKPVFPEVSNTEVISSTDFRTIKTDAALEAAGWKFYGLAPADAEAYVERVEYGENGLDLLFGNSILLNTEVELNNNDTYILDYTFKWNPSQWIFYMAMGFDPAALEGAENLTSDQIVAKLRENWTFIDGNSCFKIRANESDNAMGADSWTHYDSAWMQANASGSKLPSATALEAACGDEKAPIRVRVLISKGTGQYAFMTIGDEHFYLKRNSPLAQDSIDGLIGFTMAGSARDGRGVTLVNFNVIKCDLGDTTGGDLITEEKTKNYTDAAATYYKDGYVLHYMDFAAEGLDWASTGYSFAANSSKERIVKIEQDVLKFSNSGSKAAYLMFTGNAIPQAITEYTVTYSFRFVGDVNSYFGFIRGISLKDDGSRDKSATVELSYKGEIDDFATADAAWETIVTAMKAGEWVNVTISNVGRLVESVTVTCGDNSATFKMDPEKNKAAVDGYMGFIIGKQTSVEVAGVAVMAGKADKITAPILPTGTTEGALVQDVLAEAVAEGAKPDYSDVINALTNTNDTTDPDDPDNPTVDPDNKDPEQTTTVPAATTTTKAAEKKGCKGSIVAVPAIIATAIFGCAVVCKKKED